MQNRGRSPAVEVGSTITALGESGSAARLGLVGPFATRQPRGPAPCAYRHGFMVREVGPRVRSFAQAPPLGYNLQGVRHTLT
jgi:hypothetical protein